MLTKKLMMIRLNHIKVFQVFLVLASLLFALLASSYAEDMKEVKAVRHWSSNDTVRIVVDLSGPVEFTKGRLSNPERLFFDLKNCKLPKNIPSNYNINLNIIKMVRLGQFNANTVRIVFDIEKPDYDFKVFSLEDPVRLVVDFTPKTSGEQPKDKTTPEPIQKEVIPDTKTEAKSPPIQKKIVVLDPGHGGHDPGAVGPSGLYEKDIVLDVALKAAQYITNSYPHIEVHLTRNKDVFIPLEQRAQIANRLNADLFVSIHTNAAPNRLARGIETFLLNWTDDEEAMRVAARENAITMKQMKELKNEVSIILTSLERETKRDESVKAAGYVQNALIQNITSEYPKVSNLGVKQALFYVLVGAKMPSVLTEISFISNKEEEYLLSTEDYRIKIAQSIGDGINSYFLNLPADKISKYGKIQRNDIKSVEPVKIKTTKNGGYSSSDIKSKTKNKEKKTNPKKYIKKPSKKAPVRSV
ncbi:MAG: N-acetylmuramoyl-L-alanine amidase [Thermodesulfovibrionales bacterium]|nr:N-acetylmuramoyl-L-alanine amidase [Thermodesulfovibrionales bacterium]